MLNLQPNEFLRINVHTENYEGAQPWLEFAVTGASVVEALQYTVRYRCPHDWEVTPTFIKVVFIELRRALDQYKLRHFGVVPEADGQ